MRSAVSLTLLCTLTLERAPTPAARRAPAPPALARASAAPLRSSVPPRSPRERLLSELWFALRLRDRQALARCLSARHG
ncbi:MAG TPA: hypothetical protein DEA08_17170, partial [Planctomycetes bacterium]|nr:hypothetical protein [Planctomycetota bacterium]